MGAKGELDSGKSVRMVRDIGGDDGKGEEVEMAESNAFTTDGSWAFVWTGCLIYLAALTRSMYSCVQLNSELG